MSTLVTVFCRVYTSQCKFQAYTKKWDLFHSVKRKFQQLYLPEIVSTESREIEAESSCIVSGCLTSQVNNQVSFVGQDVCVSGEQSASTRTGTRGKGQFQHFLLVLFC